LGKPSLSKVLAVAVLVCDNILQTSEFYCVSVLSA